MTQQDDPQAPDHGSAEPQPASGSTDATPPAPPGSGDIHVTVAPGNDAKEIYIGPEIKIEKTEIKDLFGLGEALKSGQANVELVSSLIAVLARRPEPNAPRPPAPEDMPATDEAVGKWFHTLTMLNQRERCQVRATAVLHGAPAHVVNNAAHELLESCRQPQPNGKDDPPPVSPEEDMGSLVLERAFVSIRRSESDGVRRVYWKDADSNGYSEFGQRILRLLAREIEGSEGFRSENSLAMIKTWAMRPQGELAVRAAHALGAIQWDLDPNELAEQMRQWAVSAKAAERRSAPLLAVGAFAAEWGQLSQNGDTTPSNLKTQRIMDRMSRSAIWDLTPKQNGIALSASIPEAVAVSAAYRAIAVSTAYSLIGLEWTKQALDGLDYLLGLDAMRADDMPDGIPFMLCFPAFVGYMQLAASSHVRPAMARLGVRARMLTVRPTTGATGEALRKERRRKDRLFNAQLAFYFILFAATPPEARKWTQYGERERIEDRPRFNEHRNRDVLLDGVLSAGEADLRLDTQSLFWSSLASDTHELARETLKRWLETIAASSSDLEGPAATRMQAFFVSLEAKMRAWDSAAGLSGYMAPTSRLRRYMSEWANVTGAGSRQATGRLAQRIWSAFPPQSGSEM